MDMRMPSPIPSVAIAAIFAFLGTAAHYLLPAGPEIVCLCLFVCAFATFFASFKLAEEPE